MKKEKNKRNRRFLYESLNENKRIWKNLWLHSRYKDRKKKRLWDIFVFQLIDQEEKNSKIVLTFSKIIEHWDYCQSKYDRLKKLIKKKISKYNVWFSHSKYYVTWRFSKWILIYDIDARATSINIIRFVQNLHIYMFENRLKRVNRRMIESNWKK